MSEFDFARYFLLGRPHDMVLITQVPLISEQEIAETLARMKADRPGLVRPAHRAPRHPRASASAVTTCQWVEDDEERTRCENKAVVGVGNNAIWVCMEHYQTYLQLVADTVKRAVEALGR